jgi:ferredoxin
MAFKITDDCISCASCESECPNSAISEGSEHFIIDATKCTECVGFFSEQQCAAVCPVDACVTDPDNAEAKEQLLAKFAKLNPGKQPK